MSEKTIIKSAIDRLIGKGTNKKSDLVTSLELLANDDFLESKTILSSKQVIALTMADWGGQVYDIPFLNNLVRKFPRYRISGDDGRGRKEIIQIAQAIQLENERQHERAKELLGINR